MPEDIPANILSSKRNEIIQRKKVYPWCMKYYQLSVEAK